MTIRVNYPDIQAILDKSGMSETEVMEFIAKVQKSMRPEERLIAVKEGGDKRHYAVERRGLGPLTTPYGDFWQYNFKIDDRWSKYSVIVKGEIDQDTLNPRFADLERLVVRTDSGCETGQMFHDQTCDCKDQLHVAMESLEQNGAGIIVNIPRQDGRGMGLAFKLATLWLQQGLNVHTIESAGLLSTDGTIDIRTYSGVISVLKFFGVSENCVINLATNNPDKIKVFEENGYTVDTQSIVIEPTIHTQHHLQAKKVHLNHTGLKGVSKRK
jgi:3,4-dihydroxy 2-butanone 4-phosphate synthase/GTP cyclohydrolase II